MFFGGKEIGHRVKGKKYYGGGNLSVLNFCWGPFHRKRGKGKKSTHEKNGLKGS